MSYLADIKKLYTRLLNWEGEQLIPVDFVYASAINAWLPGCNEKAWGDLTGPPSSGKTAILKGFEDGERRTIVRETLTENAFSSAFRDEDDPLEDRSLANLLRYSREPRGPKLLVFPEFTTVLNMKGDKKGKLLADLRAAYDGSYRQQAGNIGADIKDDMCFGLLTACTEVLDVHRRVDQTLGQRTLMCRNARHLNDFEEGQRIADFVAEVDRIEKSDLMAEIRKLTQEGLSRSSELVLLSEGRVERPGDLAKKVGRLANLGVRIRTVPLSDKMYASSPEGPARLQLQLLGWGDSRAIFDERTTWNDEEYKLIRRVAQDTMPPDFMRVWRTLWRGGPNEAITGLPFEKLVQEAKVDHSILRQLQQWRIIELVNEMPGNCWGIRPVVAADIEYTGFMEGYDGPKRS